MLGRAHLAIDPQIGASKTFFQTYPRLPAERLTQAGIVRIAAAHSLRTRDVLLANLDPGILATRSASSSIVISRSCPRFSG